MRQKSSPKLTLLMTLPVVALLVVGWFLRDKRGTFTPLLPQTGPLRMVVTDVKFEELKPREVAEGFDTKVTLTLDLAGQLPKKGAPFGISPYVRNVRLVEMGAKPRVTKLDDESVLVVEGDNFIVPLDSNPRIGSGKLPQRLSFLLSLSKVNPSSHSVELRATISSALQAQFSRRGATIITGIATLNRLSFSHVVRQPGEIVKVPEVSRETGLTIGEPRINVSSPLSSSWIFEGAGTYITVPLLWKGNSFKSGSTNPQIRFGRPYIEDAYGKKYRTFKGLRNTKKGISSGGIGSSSNGNIVTETSTSFSFPKDAFPYSAGQLTLKALISGNDEWPVPVSVVVRRADEKPATQFPPLKVTSTQIRSIKSDKGDTEVVVKLQHTVPSTNLEAFRRELITYWSQHLVDSRAQKYTDFMRWETLTTFPNGMNAPVTKRQQLSGSMDTNVDVDQSNRQLVISYKFFLNQVPKKAGRVTFKAEIGMKSYKFLPVSVVVRK